MFLHHGFFSVVLIYHPDIKKNIEKNTGQKVVFNINELITAYR
jgi:hypothetical protein